MVCVCVSDGKRKTVLEASADDVDREGPAAVWQYATHERTLAQPDTHLPSARHTVHTLTALLLSFCSFIQTHLWKTNQGAHTCIPFCLTRASLHTHANTHTFCMPVGSADQLGTKIHNFCQLERNTTKALQLLKACWSCMRWQLLLQGIDLKSKFNWTAAQISL